MIECQNCGCTDFSLDWAGPHIKAICKSCGERFRYSNGGKTWLFVSITDESTQEPASEKQIAYATSLFKKYNHKIPKSLAGEVISTLSKFKE